MKNIKTDRLKKLSELMRQVHKLDTKRKAFDIGSWFSNMAVTDKEIVALPTLEAKVQKMNECGTNACACGWAGLVPEFRKDGFRVVDTDIKYRGESGLQAAAAFFGISYKMADYFFISSSYEERTSDITAKVVADRIDAFLNLFGSYTMRSKREFYNHMKAQGWTTDDKATADWTMHFEKKTSTHTLRVHFQVYNGELTLHRYGKDERFAESVDLLSPFDWQSHKRDIKMLRDLLYKPVEEVSHA